MELIVNNLSKRFGEKLILDHLSFSMQSGDFMALVGSSDAAVLQRPCYRWFYSPDARFPVSCVR